MLVLTIAMTLESTGAAQEIISVPENLPIQVLDEKAAKAKAEVTRRGVSKSSKVRVKLRDKLQFTGRITHVDEYSFQVRVEPSFFDDLEPAQGTVLRIPYSDVERVRGARSQAANVFIGVASIVGAIVMLAAIVVLRADMCRRSYCH